MNKKIFIASLPSTITHQELSKFFSSFGKIQKVEIIKEEGSKRCKGYAFVTFTNQGPLEQLLNSPIYYKGRKLAIREQLHGSSLRKFKESLKRRRMYISNIPKGTQDKDLYDIFERFGQLETGYIIKNYYSGANSDFGYLLFKEENSVNFVMKEKIFVKGKLIKCERFKSKKNKRKNQQKHKNCNGKKKNRSSEYQSKNQRGNQSRNRRGNPYEDQRTPNNFLGYQKKGWKDQDQEETEGRQHYSELRRIEEIPHREKIQKEARAGQNYYRSIGFDRYPNQDYDQNLEFGQGRPMLLKKIPHLYSNQENPMRIKNFLENNININNNQENQELKVAGELFFDNYGYYIPDLMDHSFFNIRLNISKKVRRRN